MLGRTQTYRGLAVAAAALALAAAGCRRDSATTGPSGLQPKDFAANLRLVAGDQQIGSIASTLTQPIQVRVVDAGGQPVSGATVTFAVRAGGGSVNPAANISGNDGIVSAMWTMGTTLGTAKVVATLTNVFLLDSAVFTATATKGPAAIFTKVSGDSQTVNAGRQLGAPIVVKVQDAFGNSLSGIRVTWAPGNLSGAVAAMSDTTVADGTASARWTLGTTATNQATTASITGGSLIAFSALATPDTGRKLLLAAGGGQSGFVGRALATAVQVLITDQYGNPVTGESVSWTDSISAGGSVSVRTGTTSPLGTASTTWTLGRQAGPQYLRAKIVGRSETLGVIATGTIGYTDVFAGNFMACGVEAATNNVYCWGAGTDGQLGNGANLSTSAPALPVGIGSSALLAVRQLTGGRNSYCALSIARQVYCWGRAPGQGGVTNTATIVNLVDPRQQMLPMALAAGMEHLCVLDLAGVGFCTGTDFAGQLGNGSFTSPAVGTYPFIAPPAGFLTTPNWSVIAAGKQHTCAFRQYVSAATVNNLVPFCWGLNNAGQLGNGDGTLANQNIPVQISLPLGFPTAYDTTSLAVGGSHTCVLDNAGAAYCWGSNGFGQTGTGALASSAARDTVIKRVAQPAGVVFSKIYAGEYHTCAIATGGAAYCWGRNDYGQLGDGTTTNATAPVPVAGGLVFRSLSVGELFTCGVAGASPGAAPPPVIPGTPSQLAGTVYCWGDNMFGQVGQNTTGNNNPVMTPTKLLYQP
ncbi:MAG: hypothetical protein IT356_05760 [Gemmatimonadaceae bacterium]|nr:hypothetical protein [Gemmatimonadaceae bacterium]